jgi:hypothetical protein
MLGGDLERLSVRALVKRQLASLSEPDPSAVTLLRQLQAVPSAVLECGAP